MKALNKKIVITIDIAVIIILSERTKVTNLLSCQTRKNNIKTRTTKGNNHASGKLTTSISYIYFIIKKV